MPTGSGLDAQVMYKLETTWGTPVTVDKAIEFDSESLAWTPTFIEPTGLRVGTEFKRGSRLVQSRETVGGDLALQFATRTMGTLVKAALGSNVTTPTLVLGSAYKQVHFPGVGSSLPGLTVQVGRPEPGGTVRAHTYAGCKCVSWEFSVGDNETAQFTISLDGRSEATATALATATFVSSEVFNFKNASVFKLGGTPSTAAGEISVAGGVTVPGIVRKFTLRGEWPQQTERYGLGNVGLKSEQLKNGTPTMTGSLEAEWDRTTFYDAYKAGTRTALELKLEGSVISGTDKNTCHFVIPSLAYKSSPFNVGGPDVVTGTVDFEVYSNEVDATLMWKLISADSAAL